MLDIGKSIFQAEIDASCELIDFLNFNIEYAYKMHGMFQPFSPEGMHNSLEFRPLEGFVFAIAPFNFFSIGGNLAAAPALLGNTAIWSGSAIGNEVLNHRNLAGIHFTGSTETFRSIWQTVSNNIANYKNYPKLVGETGGKDFSCYWNDSWCI